MSITLLRRLVAPCMLALFTVGCGDPQVTKVRHVEKAKAHMASQKYEEAVLEYRNAIKIDARFGDARYGLAEALVKAGRPADAAREYVRAAELLPDQAEIQIKAGAILLAASEFQRAQQAAEAALKLEPRNVDALLILAHAHAGLKDIGAAIREIEEAIQLAPDDSRPHTSLGGMRLAEGDRAKAETAYKRAVEIDPKSVPARLALGQFYWSGNDRARAEEQLKRAVAGDPSHLLGNRMLALFYLTAGQYADAEQPLLRLVDADDPGAMMTVADHYVRTKRAPEARKIYERLKDNSQTRATAVIRLASLDYTDGRREQAHDALDQELKLQPGNGPISTFKARLLLREGRLTESEAHARQAVEADPGSAAAHYALGLVLMARNEPEGATKAFSETLRINPRAAAAELQLSRLSLAAGNHVEALRRAEVVRAAQPKSFEARLGVATALVASRQFPKAEAELKTLRVEYPQAAAVHALYGNVLAGRGDRAGAAREFDRALEIDPSNLQALTWRVGLDLQLKRPEDARKRLNRAMASSPDTPELLLLAGRFEGAAGDHGAAERHLRRAIELNPATFAAYGLLGQIYIRQNRLDEGRAEFEQLAKLRPDAVGPKTMIGIIYELQKRPADARRVYEELVESSGGAAVAANNLAWHYAESGERLDVALQLAQDAKKLLPDRHEVDDTLGWVYVKRNLPDLAIAPLERSVKADPQNALYHFHLGVAYAKAGRPQDARRTLERALALQADFPGAEEARSTLQSLKG